MHTFYPQSRPGAPSGPPQGTHAQDGARPHSWDNSNADAQLNNLQNLLGSQQILQQIASLNQQQVLLEPVSPVIPHILLCADNLPMVLNLIAVHILQDMRSAKAINIKSDLALQSSCPQLCPV